MSETQKKTDQVVVVVIRTKTEEVVKTLGPMSQSMAERTARGVLININSEDFHTEIREAP